MQIFAENGTPQNHDGTFHKNDIFYHGSEWHGQSMVCTPGIVHAAEIHAKKKKRRKKNPIFK